MKILKSISNFGVEIFHVLVAVVMLIPIIATMGNGDEEGTEVYVDENITNPYITEYGEVDIAAHRGGAGLAPQNTLMAMERLMADREASGVDIAEFDVQLTKDGKLVLIHDLMYDDLSDATELFGKENIWVSSLTYEEARQLNMGERFKLNGEKPFNGLRGEDIPENLRIPLCEDIVEYIETNSGENKMNYLVEVKSMGLDGRKATDELYKVVKEYGLEGRFMWSTFDPFISSHMERNYPEIPRSANALETVQFYFYARMDWNLDVASPSYEALQVPYGSSAVDGLINTGTRQFLNYAHKNNISVQYWTINDENELRELVSNGADCIITDNPHFVTQVMGTSEQ
ncbi:MAG: hypothetical protein IKL16_05475 [Clostridia bacterium]|nr:hypothetical protein [Clostridia bacterium]